MEVIPVSLNIENARTKMNVTVQALKAGPGVAVHKDHFNPDKWTITHINTGCAICKDLPDRKLAKAIAVKLVGVINWSLFDDEEELKGLSKKQRRRITQIFEFYDCAISKRLGGFVYVG